jgi:hypothetical protein
MAIEKEQLDNLFANCNYQKHEGLLGRTDCSTNSQKPF